MVLLLMVMGSMISGYQKETWDVGKKWKKAEKILGQGKFYKKLGWNEKSWVEN